MQVTRAILLAFINCQYKAWLLNKDSVSQSEQRYQEHLSDTEIKVTLPIDNVAPNDRLTLVAWYSTRIDISNKIETIQVSYGLLASDDDKEKIFKTTTIHISRYIKKAQKLLNNARAVLENNEPPLFYRNSHCPRCQFWDSCYKKLKERDCISLLGGMSPKVVDKYRKKGIFSITQLSHLFRPRKRRGRPQPSGNYLWELKALAIREQKTYVMHSPDIENSNNAIYIDFEGLPDEGWIYLIGGVIKQEGKADKVFSLWMDNKQEEEGNFHKLFTLFDEYPDIPIYHYGSYELTCLRQGARKWGGVINREFPRTEDRMINLLTYLRTHVYPPIYSNGLKELATFLGFKWKDEEANGLVSISWRKEWEATRENNLREKLIQYNQDDCMALIRVNQWFQQLTTDAEQENVQQVAKMRREKLFKFQDHPEYGEDYKHISRAAYFDYQRSKIYWRNKTTRAPSLINRASSLQQKRFGRGINAWNPKKAHEIIIAPPLKACPLCGHKKLYNLRERMRMFRQTDLKFTSTGIKQHVREYRSARRSCAGCVTKFSNQPVRMRLLYGDNLFAWAINMYVTYYVSHEMVGRMLWEQFGIWTNPMYFIQRKYKWWRKWQPEVDYIWQIIRHSPVIHIDETTVRLSKDKGYVWAFATPHTVFYHFSLTREADFLHEWLKGYKGVIVTDFFAGYESIPVSRQKCLVHLIRDLNDDLYKTPFDEEYKSLVIAFSALLRKIITTIDSYGLRKIHLQKHVKDAERFFMEYIDRTHKSELSIKYGKRLKRHWDELWTFLKYDDVPWNNNNAEVAIKAFAQYRRGVNGQVGEKGLREYLQMLSIAQTCRYRNISFLEFLRRKKGIWENIEHGSLHGFLPFMQARTFTHQLGLWNKREWVKWRKTNGSPAFIPSTPHTVYRKKGWVSWSDWLGYSFLSFKKARTYMRRLGLKNRDEYWAWLKSGKRPKNIPYSPEEFYKHTGWKNLGDWLGTGNLGQQPKNKMTYIQAKAFVQAIGIKTQHDFFIWRKSGQRPETLPAAPNRSYYEFEGWGKFLGTNRIANQNKKYWDYERAKKFLQPLNIRSAIHYRELYKTGIIPDTIPKNPYSYYKKQGAWLGFPDFFRDSH